jgi:hypothetical protein
VGQKLNVGYWPRTTTKNYFAISLILVQNTFLFPVGTAKLNGDFWTTRRSCETVSTLHLFFVFFTLHQFYWCCNFYSAYRRGASKKKNLQIFVTGAAKAPCFTCGRDKCATLHLKTRGSSADYKLHQNYWLYIARTIWPILLSHLIFGQ